MKNKSIVYRDSIITIYTPTYNRGYCLHQLYDSLCRQTQLSRNFEWVIVDDGSTDNTCDLVTQWIEKAPFKIVYYWQENEGKMAKLNFIHGILDSELCMCVDSDDYLKDNAIETILGEWKTIRNKSYIAGLVGLDVYENGNIVGTKFPEKITRIKYSDFGKNGVKGDKKFVYRTAVIQSKKPYPSYKGEKFPAPGYLYRLIDVDYDLWAINKKLCVVEYLEDGLSKNKYKQFKNAPNLWMIYRLERIRLASGFNEKLRNAIHYVSSCIFARKNMFRNNNYFFLTIISLPLGILLNVYIKININKGVVK